MHEPNLEKLRRFGLAVGLVTLTYAVAGISLKSDAGISFVGLTFEVSRPELLPIGIVIASLYATIRFYYYGFMLKESPYRVRRRVLDGLYCLEHPCITGKKIPMYFGPTDFETKLSVGNPDKIQEYINTFPDAFPRFARAVPSLERHQGHASTMQGDTYVVYSVEVKIPIRCRLAAAIQDIDYSLPTWMNVISLIIFFYYAWAKS